ncbi:MAG: glutamate--tRNA ligase [Candidatus Fibromonas sp.]|jgi:glutamyl-tRNA synthetase|nr:glutamate--tRNA ligase [Candidatus Fibromonas sp.]
MGIASEQVRVRFAPSPTGYLHVGGARTAIYNYLFAKAAGGTFYLRIEDTDRKRYNEQALKDLLRDLEWLGLGWDEGPYFQSERLEIYGKAAQQLINNGNAYYCFCTEERLQTLEHGYDRHCRDLPQSEAKKRIEAGEKFVIRFKSPPDGITKFSDLIRGEIETPNKDLDDLVLLKRDKFPTYHLASVVDDHYMQTSHVLRGDEWISSTPKHVLLYNAFGWKAPLFCHLPVILAPGGGKLSKRKGAASVGDFRDLGYLPHALVNFLSLLGWSPGDDREVMSLKEMIEAFSLERIHPKAVAFDEKKLEWMNGMHIRLLPDSFFAEELKKLYPSETDENKFLKVAALLKPRLKFTTELPAMSKYFFERPAKCEDEKAYAKYWTEQSPEHIKLVLKELEKISSEEFSIKNIEAAFAKVCEDGGIKLGMLAQPVRLAVSGVGAGPGLWEILECLGKEECIFRLRRVN